MKKFLKHLKELGWKKVVASLITGGTILVISGVVWAIVLFLAYLALLALSQAYKESPAAFHYLIGFLTIAGVWMWLWHWANRQSGKQ